MSEENEEEDNPFADLEEVDADAAGDDVFAEMDASVETVSESDVLSLLDADDTLVYDPNGVTVQGEPSEGTVSEN